MAQLELRLSERVQKDTGKSEILIRFYNSKTFDVYGKSGIYITPKHFEYYIDRKKTEVRVPPSLITANKSQALKKGFCLRKSGVFVINERVNTPDVEYHKAQLKKVNELKLYILDCYEKADSSGITSKWLQEVIDCFHHPKKPKDLSLFDLMSEYIESTRLSETREKNFKVLIRALKRYEAFIRIYDRNDSFAITFDTLDHERLSDFADYLKNEHELFKTHEAIFKKIPVNTDKRKSPAPVRRGDNTIVILMKKLRAFMNWCVKQGYTEKQPFLRYDGKMSEKYGTPYYISLDERNAIADFPLSGELETQRDIFIFQCCIGCRVSDLMRLTDKNIIDGAVEYIPQKTRNDRPQVIRVPLNERAKALVEKYRGVDKKGMLFPFITPQRYNDNIKKVFKECGITRIVSVINSLTGMEEQRPINEVASSHMARRTFIGNLYKQVQDPNLIGSLSGHKYGSQAFSRYRDVDEEMKKDLVSLIE